MGKNSVLTILLLGLFALPVFAGEGNRYMVMFSDKNGTNYSIESPEDFLSEKALERRQKQNIAISQSDLPVSSTYLNSLAQIDGVNVFFTTKWFNGVLVETEANNLEEIQLLPFVREVEYVAPGIKLSNTRQSGRSSRNNYKLNLIGNDVESSAQNEFIGVDQMHKQGYKGDGKMIAIFDSGFDFIDESTFFTNLFDSDKIIGEKDFIRNSDDVFQYDSHGSKVLSCISAYKEDVYSGTAPESDLVLCVTEDVTGEYRMEEYNWLFAAEYADSIGVDIINSSVGYSYFDDESMDYTYDDLDGQTTIITQAAKLAASKGILVVSSVGNEGNNSWTYLNAPSDADSILSVGAVTYDKVRSSFSSYGPTSDGRIKPEVSALGSWVRVVYEDEVTYANGTSFSTPMVAGLAAGFWQAFPELSNIEVIEYLKMTASQANAPDTVIGWGIPNFINAFNLASANEGNIEEKFIVFPNPVNNKRLIYLYSDYSEENSMASLSFYDLKGGQVSSQDIVLSKSKEMLEIDVSFLNPGTYILNYVCNTEKQKIKLVVL